MTLLKNPTQSLTMRTNFMYSLISFVLFLIVISFTIYTMANKLYTGTIGGFAEIVLEETLSLPFITMFIIMIVIGIFAIVAIAALFLLAKIFAGHASFNQLFGQVTNFYSVLIMISVVAFILQLIGAMSFAILFTIVSIFIAILLIPLYVIVHTLQASPHKVDTFYVYLMLAGIIALLLYFVINTMVLGAIDSIMDSIMDSISLF